MQAVGEAVNILKHNNYKLTKQRQALLDYLANYAASRYVEVVQIDKYMRQKFPNMSHETIYRNIAQFEDLGIVEKKVQHDQSQSVKLQCDFHNEHHSHFICQNCGRVIELTSQPLDSRELQKQLPGCDITGQLFEVYGLCGQCKQLLTHEN